MHVCSKCSTQPLNPNFIKYFNLVVSPPGRHTELRTHLLCHSIYHILSSSVKYCINIIKDTRQSAHTWCSPPLLLHCCNYYIEKQQNKTLETSKNVLIKNNSHIACRKERKQDCTHVDYSQLNIPYHLKWPIISGSSFNWSQSTCIVSYFFSTDQLFVFLYNFNMYCIYKQISHGMALKNLGSSGTKINQIMQRKEQGYTDK